MVVFVCVSGERGKGVVGWGLPEAEDEVQYLSTTVTRVALDYTWPRTTVCLRVTDSLNTLTTRLAFTCYDSVTVI